MKLKKCKRIVASSKQGYRPDMVNASNVKTYRNKRNPNKYVEVKEENDGHTSARQYMKWGTDDGEVKNYNGSKSRRGRYSRMRKDSVNELLQDYDEVTSTTSSSGLLRQEVTYEGTRYSVRYTEVDTSPDADSMDMLRDFSGQVSEIHPYDDGDYAFARFESGNVQYVRNNRVVDRSSYMTPEDWGVENGEWCDAVIDEIVFNLHNINKDVEERIIHNSTDITAEDDFELETAEQEYDSAATSINSSKLPAVYKLVSIPEGTVGVDFGGGKFDNAVEYIRDLGATLCVYDPYNRSAEHNSEVLRILRENGGADWAINSNVLNVIKEDAARIAVLNNIKKITKPGAPIYITVYEGNGRGEGSPTKAGYQLNRKTADYLEEIQEVFPDATRRGKLITAYNSGSINSSTVVATLTDDDVSELRSELYTAGKRFMVDELFWEEDMVDDYFRVDVEKVSDDGYSGYRIEVGAEAGYDDLVRLSEVLDPIVSSYEDGAYFEPETSGILVCYIWYEDSSIEECTSIEGSTYRDHDVEEQLIEVYVDTNIEVNDEGYFDYEDTSWATDLCGNNGWVQSYDYPNLDLIEEGSLIETIDDFLVHELPDTPGIYHVVANFELYFDVEGVYDDVHDGGWDDREGEWEDFDTISDNADVTYNKDKSKMTSFSCERSLN